MKTEQKRREFLKISAAGALGVMVLGTSACKPGAKPVATTPDRKSFVWDYSYTQFAMQ